MTDEPAPSERNIRGNLLLLLAEMDCWKRSACIQVGALAGDAETEAWLDDAEPPRWLPFEEPATVTRVTDVPDDLVTAVQQHLPTLRAAFSQTTEMGYWMNHCPHCDAGTGDFYTHAPDGPFFAQPLADRTAIRIIELGVGELDAEPPYITPPEFKPRRRTSKKNPNVDEKTGLCMHLVRVGGWGRHGRLVR